MSSATERGSVSATESQTGRYRQRRRTRSAIINATAELLQSGRTAPGVNEIADAADVSRRTVYQYFPTVEQLLLDATLGLLSQAAVDDAIDQADPGGDDALRRVSAMIRALTDMSSQTMPLGRSLIRLTVDAPAGSTGQPKRGYRRIDWIETAIEPLRGRLDDAGFERLVSALAMVIGWEALIVLQDLRGLAPGEHAEVSTWAARALIQAALQDRLETSRADSQRPPTRQASPSSRRLSGDPTAGAGSLPAPRQPT
jgi:AcrR family transcriptional regulator